MKSQNELEGLKELSGASKWIKELVGIPTYIASILLATMFVGSNILVNFVVFMCFVMIYHLVYAFIFPGFNVEGKRWILGAFIIGQLFFWAIIFLGLWLWVR